MADIAESEVSTDLPDWSGLPDAYGTLSQGRSHIHVYPEGDLMLNVGIGRNACSIKVSKAVLCTQSSMFNTMLHSKFREGIGGGQSIDLSNEDTQTVLDLCYLMHNQPEKIGKVDGPRLFKIVLQAHFRCAIGSIRSWASDVLHNSIIDESCYDKNKLDDGTRIDDVITLAHVLNLPVLFRTLSQLMIYGKTIKDRWPASRLSDIRPAGLAKLLIAKQVSVRADLISELSSCMRPHIKGSEHTRRGMTGRKRAFGAIVVSFHEHGLSPIALPDYEGSTWSMLENLEKVHHDVQHMIKHKELHDCEHCDYGYDDDCYDFDRCDACQVLEDFEEALGKIVREHKKERFAMCLDCFNNGLKKASFCKGACGKLHGPRLEKLDVE